MPGSCKGYVRPGSASGQARPGRAVVLLTATDPQTGHRIIIVSCCLSIADWFLAQSDSRSLLVKDPQVRIRVSG